MSQASLSSVRPAEAWQPWSPSPGDPWDLRRAAHLYRRAAFGADWASLQAALAQSPGDVVEQLLAGGDRADQFEQEMLRKGDQLADRELPDSSELRQLWLGRMLHSPHPLREKLTLFWHNHFATSFAKVGRVRLMQQQNELLRRHALGKFGDLALEIGKDPAMMVWLDANDNVKVRPNENYARELFEAFTLGHGNFSENDVQEAARTFTGWRIQGDEHRFVEADHDFGTKTILGQTGRWSGDDVVRIALEQPAAARFLVRKLFRFLISEAEDPPVELIEPLAERLRRSDYDVGLIVGVMLRSNLFFSDLAYRRRVKGPVEFVLSIVNHLRTGVPAVAPAALAIQLDGLGQTLYSPPTVFGWQGGVAWITSSMLLARQNLAFEFALDPFRGDDPADLVASCADGGPDEQVDFMSKLLLDDQISAASRQKLVEFLAGGDGADLDERQRIRETTHLLMLMPEYQLA